MTHIGETGLLAYLVKVLAALLGVSSTATERAFVVSWVKHRRCLCTTGPDALGCRMWVY